MRILLNGNKISVTVVSKDIMAETVFVAMIQTVFGELAAEDISKRNISKTLTYATSPDRMDGVDPKKIISVYVDLGGNELRAVPDCHDLHERFVKTFLRIFSTLSVVVNLKK